MTTRKQSSRVIRKINKLVMAILLDLILLGGAVMSSYAAREPVESDWKKKKLGQQQQVKVKRHII